MSSTGPMSDQAWAMKLEAEVRDLRADRTALMDAAVTYMATIDRLRALLDEVLRHDWVTRGSQDWDPNDWADRTRAALDETALKEGGA